MIVIGPMHPPGCMGFFVPASFFSYQRRPGRHWRTMHDGFSLGNGAGFPVTSAAMAQLFFIKKLFARQRDLIFRESRDMRDFVQLLMKQRNTGVKWTADEIHQLKAHLRHLARYIPALVIFALPFGSLLLPLLAELVDRRKRRRRNN